MQVMLGCAAADASNGLCRSPKGHKTQDGLG